MSKKKKQRDTVESYNKRKINSSGFKAPKIIHGEKSIYTNKVSSLDGKKVNKRTCIYYNIGDMKCSNKNCSKVICTTAKDCTCYKRREKEPKRKLSNYDDTFIQLPTQQGTHERNNEYIGISKNIGTSCHVGYLQGDGHRRHKVRCVYYDKVKKFCEWFMMKCTGSSKCDKYEEKNN